jgi:hypothetical protein
MPCKITNVATDHAYALKRRMAARLEMEPVIAGERLRLRASRILTDEQFLNNKDLIALHERNGVLTSELSEDATKLSFPDIPAPTKEPDPIKESLDAVVARTKSETDTAFPPIPPPPADEPSSTASEEEPTSPPPPPSGAHPQRKDDKKRGR